MKTWQIFLIGFILGVIVGAGGLLTWASFKLKSKRRVTDLNSAVTLVSPGGAPSAALRGDAEIAELLEPIRQKYHLPALGGAIVDSEGISVMAVDGMRKQGESAEVTIEDVWHLGSDTKAMTATMIAALVEQGKLSWDSKLGDIFADLRLPAPMRKITLLHLLTHRGGLPANADWKSLSETGSLVEQRRAAVAQLASIELLSSPGSRFAYSNWDYVVVAAMAEQVTGISYENLMKTILFEPLLMHSVGYGPTGTPSDLSEPWGHTVHGVPYQIDNPLVMAPAGGVHCSLEDWCKFISDQLRGSEGKHALLKTESYTRMHTAPFGGSYALGWLVANRAWGGGRVFTHAGSNTLNMAVVWMAPAHDFAALVVCNQAGSEKACDEAIAGLIALRKKASGTP
jgi:CubicO group peptidase (beta-lactamase class C family)